MSEKSFIYHQVPEQMQGDVLHPLNDLQKIHPEVYAREVAKYSGREHVMEEEIPPLNARWNDVLHFSAVHPAEIKESLSDAGHSSPPDIEVFEIDAHLLKPENTIVYLPKIGGQGSFVEFDPRKIAGYAVIPEETKDYYRRMIAKGKNPLTFLGVPHIFYKGSLDVSKVRKIKTGSR
nr:Unknown Function [uncultured bacterium]